MITEGYKLNSYDASELIISVADPQEHFCIASIFGEP